RPEEALALRALLETTGAFTPGEVDVALELIDGGEEGAAPWGYRFTVAEDDGVVTGYACYGRSWFTEASWDLYWIAVDPGRQRAGVGAELLAGVEAAAAAENGRTVLVETALKPSYEASRRFYAKHGYVEIARVPDFYAGGDDEDGAIALGNASLYNHSYSPSARYVSRIPERVIEFVATRDIAAGEEITVNYNRDHESHKPVWFEPV